MPVQEPFGLQFHTVSVVSRERLLVLGSSGFLGAHLVREGAERFGCVHAASRRPELYPGTLPANARSVPWDGRQAMENVKLFADARPTVVIVAAALSRLAACERDPDVARELNGAMPGGIARLARDFGARLVHISTDLVFGARPPLGERYGLTDPPAPLSVYGHSKVEGEERVLEANSEALVCRLPLLFGNSFGRGLGASDALLAAIERDETPVLFVDEWRTPLDVGNAAEALVELALGDACGMLHLAGPDRLSRAGLGREVLRSHGFSDEQVDERVRCRTRAELGLESQRPADVGLDAGDTISQLQTPLLGVCDVL